MIYPMQKKQIYAEDLQKCLIIFSHSLRTFAEWRKGSEMSG
jgi:hypothetical protein